MPSDLGRLRVGERISCLLLIGWLQFVGWFAHSVIHHILHAAPLVLLLFLPASSVRYLTGLLAGYMWIFMLAGVSSMLHTSFCMRLIFMRPDNIAYWLAPVAAGLAILWTSLNSAILTRRPNWFFPFLGVWLGVTGVFTITHPYLSTAIEYPLDRVLAGQFLWIFALLLETAVVLALPFAVAFRMANDLKFSWKMLGHQVAFWVFFVVMMVVGLLPVLN